MAEEARFFLRTAAYSALVGLVYWFISYEVAGSVLLGAVVFATGLVVGVFIVVVRATRGELVPGHGGPMRRAGLALARLVGFEDPPGPAGEQPIAAGLEPVPLGSVWPLVTGVAAAMVALGLVFGPWLTFPGIAVGAFAVWGWISQAGARA